MTRDSDSDGPFRFAHFRVWLRIGWLLVALVVFLSLGPPGPEVPVRHFDKLGHGLAYLTITAWFGALYQGRRRLGYAMGFLVMGTMLEWIQGTTTYRAMDSADMIANALGVACGLALAYGPASRFLRVLDRRL